MTTFVIVFNKSTVLSFMFLSILILVLYIKSLVDTFFSLYVVRNICFSLKGAYISFVFPY